MHSARVYIPFKQMLPQLLLTVVPCLFGVLITYLFPKVKNRIEKIAKPVSLFFLVFSILFILSVKFYVFRLVELKQWIMAPFIPW
jgi:predicted Na+-dependent transporter